MKKIILSLVVASIAFASCKKDKTVNPTCESTVLGIAGAYKITKVVASPSGLGPIDITATYLSDACTASGVYQLNAADSSVTYSQTASCLGSGSGSYNVVGSAITIESSGNGDDFAGTISSWNCTDLVIRDLTSGTTLDYTLTKQ